MITVYTMVYNEEIILQFMINHYRERFPGCKIVFYDNESTDNTASIALKNNCEVIPYYTNHQVDDDKLRNLKNNCWKTATTDWVLVCDADELLDITEADLKNEEANGTTIIKSEAYNMVNLEDNYDLESMKHGSRCSAYDKDFLFKKTSINEINYVHGGHHTNPIGTVKPSAKKYLIYHYINIHPNLTFNKIKYTKDRLSETNKRNGWGTQYFREYSMEEINDLYKAARAGVSKIR